MDVCVGCGLGAPLVEFFILYFLKICIYFWRCLHPHCSMRATLVVARGLLTVMACFCGAWALVLKFSSCGTRA